MTGMLISFSKRKGWLLISCLIVMFSWVSSDTARLYFKYSHSISKRWEKARKKVYLLAFRLCCVILNTAFAVFVAFPFGVLDRMRNFDYISPSRGKYRVLTDQHLSPDSAIYSRLM